MSDGSLSENRSEHNVSPTAANTEELDSEVSDDQRVTRIKTSVTSNITRKIRSKLPILGYFLRRLAKLKNGEKLASESEKGGDGSSEVAEITESILNRVMLEIPSASTTNEQSIPEDGDSVGWSESTTAETRWPEVQYGAPSDHFTELDSERPSTSNTYTDDEYHTSTTVVQTEPLQIIGHSVNTEAMTTNGTFVNVLNRDTSAAGSILEFAEALSTQLGTRTERLRGEESRTVPLVYIQSEDRHELYLQSTMTGESAASGSSTIGSEISSMSEGEYPQTRNRRIGQDSIPPYYDAMLGVERLIRKPLCRKDEEPTIY